MIVMPNLSPQYLYV